MRGAIVGFGTIAMGHMVGYSRIDELSIVAVVDPSAGRRKHAEQAFGLRAYTDLGQLVEHEQLDFIDICAPPSSHSEYSKLGLAHGMHVLCEKPVFMPAEEGYESLLADIWASDRIFYPCHVYKFAPILDSMRDLISAPEFGEVRGANFRTVRRGHAIGVPEWRPDWRREPKTSGGGILRDHGPHSIYLAMNLTGHTPVAVSCLLGNLQQDRYADTEDTVLLRLRCADDVEIALNLTWAADCRNTGYSIMGSSGSVVVEGDNLTAAASGNVVRKVIESGFDDPSHQEWFHRMLLDFVDMVNNPGRQAELVREALITSLVIDGAYASAAAGGQWFKVEVPAVLLAPSG